VPTEKAPLTFTAESKELLEVQANKGKNNIDCLKFKGSGSFTSQDLGKATLDIEGCTANAKAVKCWSLGDEKAGAGKEVILVDSAALHLVDILPAGKLELGLAVTRATTVIVDCQGGIVVEVKGTLIGVVEGVVGGVKTKAAKVNFAATGGVQNVRECMTAKVFCEGKKYELEANFGAGFSPAAEVAKASITFAKEAEFHF
jgi:hypothetical protein